MLPRLLRGIAEHAPDFDAHCAIHGPVATRAPVDLLEELDRSGLRGRGGGGFPLSVKLAAVRRRRSAPVLLVNGCEGEPMSAKDRLLLRRAPHLVLDGALALAGAIGARDVIIAVDERGGDDAVARAVNQRPEPQAETVALVAVPAGYVSGQETALVRYCNGGVALPTSGRGRVTERGIGRRPTLVCNVETVAHVALIARNGAGWFRSVGTADDPGSALVTVSGAVASSIVCEVAHGDPVAAVIDAAGGLTEPARALLIGGYAGAWVDASPDALRLPLSRAGLAPTGTRLGPGVVVALPGSACPVAELVAVTGWLSAASAGQCGPCVNGLGSIAGELLAIRDGHAAPGAGVRIRRWGQLAAGRGACAHPDGAVSFVMSGLRVFASELSDHLRYGPCDACDRPGTLVTRAPAPAPARDAVPAGAI